MTRSLAIFIVKELRIYPEIQEHATSELQLHAGDSWADPCEAMRSLREPIFRIVQIGRGAGASDEVWPKTSVVSVD